jgi:hypothetical protein
VAEKSRRDPTLQAHTSRCTTRTPVPHLAAGARIIKPISCTAGIGTEFDNQSLRATGTQVSQERHDGKGRSDGESRLDAHDAALRPAAGRLSLDEVERIVI